VKNRKIQLWVYRDRYDACVVGLRKPVWRYGGWGTTGNLYSDSTELCLEGAKKLFGAVPKPDECIRLTVEFSDPVREEK
jgi:hypothetical protein